MALSQVQPRAFRFRCKCHIRNLYDTGIIFQLSLWISLFTTELRQSWDELVHAMFNISLV
jgi:hypothetical protein